MNDVPEIIDPEQIEHWAETCGSYWIDSYGDIHYDAYDPYD